jgi:hypothetical protein
MLPLAEPGELDEPAELAVVGVLLGLLLLHAAASSATATAAPSRTGTGTPASEELPIVIIASRAAPAVCRRRLVSVALCEVITIGTPA